MTNRPSAALFLALYTLICLIWGSTWLVIQIGGDAHLPPFVGAAIRFIVAAIILWIWVFIARIPLPKGHKEVRASVINGVLSAGTSYAIVYWCAQFVPSGLESVIFGTMPLWTILFGAFVFKTERLTITRLTGVLLGLLGIALIFLPEVGHVTATEIAALVVMLVSPMVSAISLLITKSQAREVHPVALNAVAISIGAIMLSGIAGLTSDVSHIPWSFTHLWTIGYLAIFGTVISFIVYYKLLRTTAAVTMSYVALLTPVIAVLLGWVVRDERLGIYSILGSVSVLIGVWFATRPASKAT